jgi:hypothetical protein
MNVFRFIKGFLVLITSLFCLSNLTAQISITSSRAGVYNITPSDLVQIVVLNNSSEASFYIEAQLTNSSNEKILSVVTSPFTLKKGLNNIQSNQLNFSSVSYSSSNQGNFIKTNKRLPTGNFNYCVRIVPVTQFEDGDEYCQEFDANDNGMLYLIYPSDEEILETKTPLLMWMHNEPFNLLAQGESFRLLLVELDKNQSAESGIQMKSPIFMKNNLTQHQVQYAFDAQKLEEGKHYGWKIQKIANGSVVNETESWKFSIKEEVKPTDFMFATLKKELDGSFYRITNDRIYFKFQEKYQPKSIHCKIFDEKNKEILPQLNKVENSEGDVESVAAGEMDIKKPGHNQFELDLQPYQLKSGYYILEVLNEKKERFKLKFHVE